MQLIKDLLKGFYGVKAVRAPTYYLIYTSDHPMLKLCLPALDWPVWGSHGKPNGPQFRHVKLFPQDVGMACKSGSASWPTLCRQQVNCLCCFNTFSPSKPARLWSWGGMSIQVAAHRTTLFIDVWPASLLLNAVCLCVYDPVCIVYDS